MANKESIKYDGVTLTEGGPSSAGKRRFFGEGEDHKTKTEIDGKVYTVFHTISLYEEGSVPVKVTPKQETFDSAQRKVDGKVKVVVPKTSDGGNADMKAEMVRLAAAMGLKLV